MPSDVITVAISERKVLSNQKISAKIRTKCVLGYVSSSLIRRKTGGLRKTGAAADDLRRMQAVADSERRQSDAHTR